MRLWPPRCCRFGFVCSSAHPRPGERHSSWVRFFASRIRLSVLHFAANAAIAAALLPVWVRLFVRTSTPGAPLLKVGSFFRFANPARLSEATPKLGSFFQPVVLAGGAVLKQLQDSPRIFEIRIFPVRLRGSNFSSADRGSRPRFASAVKPVRPKCVLKDRLSPSGLCFLRVSASLR
jgi:hypothetical protein